MKKKNFKIASTTLFVYKSKSGPNGKMETDPTTSMITMTRTGILKAVR